MVLCMTTIYYESSNIYHTKKNKIIGALSQRCTFLNSNLSQCDIRYKRWGKNGLTEIKSIPDRKFCHTLDITKCYDGHLKYFLLILEVFYCFFTCLNTFRKVFDIANKLLSGAWFTNFIIMTRLIAHKKTLW